MTKFEKCDVYSMGVVILSLAHCKDVSESLNRNDQNELQEKIFSLLLELQKDYG